MDGYEQRLRYQTLQGFQTPSCFWCSKLLFCQTLFLMYKSIIVFAQEDYKVLSL